MRRFALPAILVASLSVTACTDATTSGGTTASARPAAFAMGASQKTAAERQLEADARSLKQTTNDIIVRNTAEGALAGALAGCGLAVLMGGSARDCAVGAVAGGVAGGVAGNQVGRAAAAKNVQLVQRDQVLANLKGVSAKLNTVERNLAAVVKSQNSEIASLNRQLKGGQISQSAYTARVNAINSNRSTVSAALAESERDIVETRKEIRVAQQQGQKDLAAVDSAALSTQNRLARNRKLLTIVK